LGLLFTHYARPHTKILTLPASQFTSTAFTTVLLREQIAISMDGKGCWRDNVFVERLWRSVKYEEVYLNAYASVPEARAGIGRYLAFYNAVRPHSALGGRTPDSYTSTSRFSQRHDQPAAVHLSRPRACPDKPSHLC
jgi:transposase InsO family protein